MDKQSLNLLLLDDAIPKFTGTLKTYTASRWTQDVEDNAEIFGLTPQHTWGQQNNSYKNKIYSK